MDKANALNTAVAKWYSNYAAPNRNLKNLEKHILHRPGMLTARSMLAVMAVMVTQRLGNANLDGLTRRALRKLVLLSMHRWDFMRTSEMCFSLVVISSRWNDPLRLRHFYMTCNPSKPILRIVWWIRKDIYYHRDGRGSTDVYLKTNSDLTKWRKTSKLQCYFSSLLPGMVCT